METELGASPQIPVLLGIAAIAAFWMFIWKTKTERRATRLINWVWENYPQSWAALPWLYRNVLRERGLAELARRKSIGDPHFQQEFAAIQPFRRHILIAGIIAGTALALILFGTSFLGWRF